MKTLREVFSQLTDMPSRISDWNTIQRFRRNREKFYADLADAIKDTESVATFLEIRRTRAIEQKDKMASVYQRMLQRQSTNAGDLSHVLEGSVPSTDLLVISAIESRADLHDGLNFLADTIQAQRQMIGAVREATFIPVIISSATAALVAVLSFFVIPVFVQVVPPDKWPPLGRSIYFVTSLVRDFWPVMLLLGLLAVWWSSWSLHNWTGPLRKRMDNHVPYSVIRDFQGAVFLVSLASLMVSGEGLVRSLEKLKIRAKPWLRWHIGMIHRRLLSQEGGRTTNQGEAFATGVFDRDLSNRLIDKARRSSDFNQVIRKLGVEGINESRERISRSAKRLNVALVITLGVVVGYLVIGTFATAQGLSKGVRESVQAEARRGR